MARLASCITVLGLNSTHLKDLYMGINGRCKLVDGALGWKFMSCCHCQQLGQQASWLLIGCTRVNNQSEARSVR